jgi:hypothetical protein
MAALLGHLRSINDRLDQQAAQSVVVPAVPAALTTTTAQEVGKTVAALSEHMLAADSGESSWVKGVANRLGNSSQPSLLQIS